MYCICISEMYIKQFLMGFKKISHILTSLCLYASRPLRGVAGTVEPNLPMRPNPPFYPHYSPHSAPRNVGDLYASMPLCGMAGTIAISLKRFLKPIKKLFLCTFQKYIQLFSR